MNTYIKCLLSGAPVPFPLLIAMRLRQVPVEMITDAYIRCRKAGIDLDMEELETEYLAAPDDFELYVKERVNLHREEVVKPEVTVPRFE